VIRRALTFCTAVADLPGLPAIHLVVGKARRHPSAITRAWAASMDRERWFTFYGASAAESPEPFRAR
jgi:hypothetical protein